VSVRPSVCLPNANVRIVIDGCGRLDVKNLILLRKIQFYRCIFYMNDCVLHKLFCALMSNDSRCMISVFTHEAASNVYVQFHSDLGDWCGRQTDTMTLLYFFAF